MQSRSGRSVLDSACTDPAPRQGAFRIPGNAPPGSEEGNPRSPRTGGIVFPAPQEVPARRGRRLWERGSPSRVPKKRAKDPACGVSALGKTGRLRPGPHPPEIGGLRKKHYRSFFNLASRAKASRGVMRSGSRDLSSSRTSSSFEKRASWAGFRSRSTVAGRFRS